MTTRRASALIILALVIAASVGVAVGSVPLAPQETWRGLWSGGGTAGDIVRQLRLPRVVLALLVGGSLSLSGAALQALVRNPLADPYLLGLSGGAGLGAVSAIALNWSSEWALPLAAFAGALGAVALVYRLSIGSSRRIDPRVLLLAGVVVGAFAAAVMSAIITMSDATRLRNAFLWLLGGLGGSSWRQVLVFSAYGALPLAALFTMARSLDLLSLGDEPARHLGGDLETIKRRVVITTTLLTGAAVATCGIIGFVGLVVPHAVRRLIGPLHRPLLPLVFATGGIFLILADALARTVVSPIELPVGVVTALVGVPLFAVLLRRTMA